MDELRISLPFLLARECRPSVRQNKIFKVIEQIFEIDFETNFRILVLCITVVIIRAVLVSDILM